MIMSPVLGTLFGDVLNGAKKSWLIRVGFLLAVASTPSFAQECKGAAYPKVVSITVEA
jgi:hypothetical protein